MKKYRDIKSKFKETYKKIIMSSDISSLSSTDEELVD